MIQTFHHPEFGPIQFTDNHENERSKKARPSDLRLVTPMSDRSITAAIKRAICDDINLSYSP